MVPVTQSDIFGDIIEYNTFILKGFHEPWGYETHSAPR